MQPSPYTPGSVAKETYGREKHMKNLRRELAFLAQFQELVGRVSVFVGPRGVGKTSLLRAAQREAENIGINTIFVTAGDGPFVQELMLALEELSETWHTEAKDYFRGLIKSLRITLGGFSIEAPQTNDGASRNLGRQLQELLTSAGDNSSKKGKGLLILIDEIQAAGPEGMRAFAYAWQHMQAENPDLPAMTIAAGLSHAQDAITDAVSFAERFRYVYLSNLDGPAAQNALTQPAKAQRVTWSETALSLALSSVQGYPYFLQVIGDETWADANYPSAGYQITEENVSNGLLEFNEIRQSFFRARWAKATPKEQEVLRAMARLGGGRVSRSDIACELGISTQTLSQPRANLIDKGLVSSPEHGFLEFTAPGFAEYVLAVDGA